MAYWRRQRATCWATHVDYFHQVWSWYDYPSPSYSVLVRIRYVTLWPWPLTCWHWTVMKHGRSRGQTLHQVWRSYAYPLLTYSSDVRHRPLLTMPLEPLRMRRITWPVRRKQIFPNIWNPWPRFVYSLCNTPGTTIKVNWVICQNSVWPCVKGECDVCVCAKSRDLLVAGRKQLHFWNFRPRYSLYNFYGATMTIKDRLYNTWSDVQGENF